MATSLKTRVIYRKSSDTATTFKLLMAAQSIPSPLGSPNLVESTTLEDVAQTNEMGIKQSNQMDIEGKLTKADLAAITALEGEELEFMVLYGTDGLGSVAQYSFSGNVTVVPSDVGGVDELLKMKATIVATTVPKLVSYTITESSGAFTVTEA